jgi:peptidoglycan/LPS O-acetylase OafA/YrhL
VSTQTQFRFIALDGLRGVAALVVVMHHIDWPNHLTHIAFFKNGYLAVDLFFILSGFVICSSYSTKIVSGATALQFIWLRFFRVYPLHLAVLVAFVVLELAKLWSQNAGLIFPGQEPFTKNNSVQALVANVFLLQGFGIFDRLTWNGPSWSISCEFAAYLAFAFAALTGLLRRQSVFTVGVLLAAIGYVTLALARDTLDVSYDWGVVRCLSGFFFGVAIFELTKNGTGQRAFAPSKASIWVAETTLIVMLGTIMFVASGAAIILTIPVFVGLVAVLQRDSGPVARVLMSAPAQFFGRISYSIYMVQILFLVVLFDALKRGIPALQINQSVGDVLVLVSMVAIVAISSATYALIEAPARHWGRKFLISRKPSSARP